MLLSYVDVSVGEKKRMIGKTREQAYCTAVLLACLKMAVHVSQSYPLLVGTSLPSSAVIAET